MTITYALMSTYEDICQASPDRATLLTKANVTHLIRDGNHRVTGVEYEYDGKSVKAYGVVILGTGGYAADFTETSLLKKYRPELINLATTNGDHCTGDGIKMALEIGANTIHMDRVQVHPTGLVDPSDPEAKVKFLAAEALRGVGGLLLDGSGNRFADELGHRDYVTGEMWKRSGPFRLVLNSKAAKEIEWHCKHYMSRGLMKHYKDMAEMAKDCKIPVDALTATFKKYSAEAAKSVDPFGKKFFANLPFSKDDQYYVSVVIPCLHFTMGGVQIDSQARVLSKDGPVGGLFACGEMAGGVHGQNRLGGSSLLGCVVYGRIAAHSATSYLLSQLTAQLTAQRRLESVSSHLEGPVSFNVGKMHISVSYGVPVSSHQTLTTHIPATDIPTAKMEHKEESKVAEKKAEKKVEKKAEMQVYSLADVSKHNKDKDCWVVVNGQVLNVTNFMKDHPGGKRAIMIYAGKDATEEFNMLHKKEVVQKYAAYTIIGSLQT